MMRYALICDQGHEFEGWFRGSAAYEAQARDGMLSCAQCGSTRIEKAIMAPSVARRDRQMEAPARSSALPSSAGFAPAAGALSPPAQPMALLDPEAVKLRAAIKALRGHVEATAQNVGPAFADIARDMHDGVVEHEPIYGTATAEEVNALHEDGIAALPLPVLPEERN